jgi:Zn-dependent protease
VSEAAENPPPASPVEPPATPPPPALFNRERIVVVVLLIGLGALAVSQGAIDREAIITILAIVPSVILHEVSHGAVAFLFGDDTAKRAGRLTLNPLSHIDPMGTIILPTLLALSHATPFGFAKPVPVNIGRLRHPRNDSLFVSLAGPFTNYSLAFIAAMIWRFWTPTSHTLREFLFEFGLVNVVLGTFNLLPVPPLDGSGILERVLPEKWWPAYLNFRRYSMLLVFLVVFRFSSVISNIIEPVFRVWLHLARLDFLT